MLRLISLEPSQNSTNSTKRPGKSDPRPSPVEPRIGYYCNTATHNTPTTLMGHQSLLRASPGRSFEAILTCPAIVPPYCLFSIFYFLIAYCQESGSGSGSRSHKKEGQTRNVAVPLPPLPAAPCHFWSISNILRQFWTSFDISDLSFWLPRAEPFGDVVLIF